MSNKWDVQDSNDDAVVKVTSQYSRDNADIPQTDILVIDKSTNEHVHITIDENGVNMTSWHDWR